MPIYAIAIGSNRRHVRHGAPPGVVAAAIAELDRQFELFDASPILINPAAGGAGRDFANAAALIEAEHSPGEMLDGLKRIEREFGRRPGRRWGPRVLDLDILAWEGGDVATRRLTIPHRALAERSFMALPLAAIAPGWRIAGHVCARHLVARLGKRGSRR